MVLILDNNQLGPNDLTLSTRMHAFTHIARHLGVSVLIPRICFLEHLHEYEKSHFEELIEQRKRDIASGGKAGLSALSEDELRAFAHRIVSTYGHQLETSHNISAKYTVEEYEVAIEREIWRRLPAHTESGNGARDVLVWLDAMKAAKSDGITYLISNDQKAFGKDAALHRELVDELATRGLAIRYVNNLEGLVADLGLRPSHTHAAPSITESMKAALDQEINSAVVFMRLLAHVPEEERGDRAWTATWTGDVDYGDPYEKYHFTLDNDGYLCVAQPYATKKTFVLASLETSKSSPVPWHFMLHGTIVVSVRYDRHGVVLESDVVNSTFDDDRSTITSPSGDSLTLAEARRESA